MLSNILASIVAATFPGMDCASSAAGIDTPLPAATLVPALRHHAEHHHGEEIAFEKALAALRRHVAAALFDSQDEVELETAFDDLLDDSQFTTLAFGVIRSVSLGMVQESADVLQDDTPPSLLALFRHSGALMKLARDSWALTRALTVVALEIRTAAAKAPSPRVPFPRNTSDALAAPGPVFLKRLLLNARKADAANWALLAAARAPKEAPVDDWITEILLQTWNTALQRYLQVTSALGFALPDKYRDLVPAGPAIDVHGEIRASAIREVRNQEQLASARNPTESLTSKGLDE